MAGSDTPGGDFQLYVPPADARALKAMLAAHPRAARFLIYDLCGVLRSSFLLTSDVPMTLAMREGERRVGLKLLRIMESNPPDDELPEPPARTMSERQARRQRAKPPQG